MAQGVLGHEPKFPVGHQFPEARRFGWALCAPCDLRVVRPAGDGILTTESEGGRAVPNGKGIGPPALSPQHGPPANRGEVVGCQTLLHSRHRGAEVGPAALDIGELLSVGRSDGFPLEHVCPRCPGPRWIPLLAGAFIHRCRIRRRSEACAGFRAVGRWPGFLQGERVAIPTGSPLDTFPFLWRRISTVGHECELRGTGRFRGSRRGKADGV